MQSIKDSKFRYLNSQIKQDISSKMVFVGGPRQVGKTTMVKNITDQITDNPIYLNWDLREDRQAILSGQLPASSDTIIFDEIHKYPDWKNYLKGIYDTKINMKHIIATGSARINVYMKGEDSLLGRYHYHVLHPFSLAEMLNQNNRDSIKVGNELDFPNILAHQELEQLLKFGGFPEPLLLANETNWRRWVNERVDRLVREDIREISSVDLLGKLKIMSDFLPSRVGSLFSAHSLGGDIGVSGITVDDWLELFQQLYYVFSIKPYNANPVKSQRRRPIIYMWDWSEVKDESIRLENMVASHLYKFVHYYYYAQGYKLQLHYIRDKEQREVDFLISLDGKPWFAVEVKQSHTEVSKDLRYFKQKLNIPYAYQVVDVPKIDILSQEDIRIISIDKFLTGLV